MNFRLSIFLVILFIHTSLPSLATSIDEVISPSELNDGWTTDNSINAGFDEKKIRALATALESKEYLNVHAVLVEHKGMLVYEQYLTGDDQDWGTPIGQVRYDGSQVHDLRSISKSVTALLLGIALEDDLETRLNLPLHDYLTKHKSAFNKEKKQITLRQVLSMSAGFDWNEMTVPYSSGNNDEIQLYRTRDPIGYVLSKTLRDQPDQRWYYNGGMTMLAAAVIEEITQQSLLKFAEEKLFKPLGIDRYTWHRSSAWENDHMPAVASGLRLLPRDLAKIGSLMLHEGQWQGKQIVPKSWIKLSGHRYREDMQPWDRSGTYGYGLQWWQGKFRQGNRVISATTGVGYGGQRLFTTADVGLSVTILAGNYGTGRPQSIWQSERIFERILEAMQL